MSLGTYAVRVEGEGFKTAIKRGIQVTDGDNTHVTFHLTPGTGVRFIEYSSGARNAGVVTFHPLAENKTRIVVQLEYDPEGFVETVGDIVGVVSTRVRGDLDRFKEFIESRGHETGAWRGRINQPPHNRRWRFQWSSLRDDEFPGQKYC